MRKGSGTSETNALVHGASVQDPELRQGFERIDPDFAACPLVFCSPHSGSVYPRRFLADSRLDALTLRRSEDAHVEKLFAFAPQIGAPMLKAVFPRAFLDVNREPYELDPRMFDGRLPAFANTRSLRVAGGLGTIARIVGEAQEIYSRRLTVSEALARIDHYYRPFHKTLQDMLANAELQFGMALLLDCHSMPSSANATDAHGRLCEEPMRADFVIGDRFGTSCDRQIVDLAEYELTRRGYTVVRNKPYAGGYITEHYGHPGSARHALQLEINRALYMNERSLEPNGYFERLSEDLRAMSVALAEWTVSSTGHSRLAAE